MLLLVVSVCALAVGPIVYRVADAARQSLLALDGFILIAISGLVLVHIIPHSIVVAGPIALVAALAGFFGPGLIEHRLHHAARRAHTVTLVLACVGLAFHAFLDGVALGTPELEPGHADDSTSVLAIAVALHRLPVAVTLWWLLRPSAGRLYAGGTLGALAIMTVAGYALGSSVSQMASDQWLATFQALVAGSLMHVVIHRPAPTAPPSDEAGGQWFAGLGALLGLAVVAVLADTHLPMPYEPRQIAFGEAFVTLALDSAPALVLAFALAGLVQVYLPQASLGWMRTGNPVTEAGRGVVFGLPLPICSCGVIPLYRSLITRGVPATAGMAFLVATPELGLDAVLISLPLLGAELAIARVVASVIVALLVGVVVGAIAHRAQAAPPPLDASGAVVRGNMWRRIRLGLGYGFGEIVDHIGPWLLLGLVIASLIEPLINGAWLVMLPWGVDVLIFALLGMPAYVCASGATPLVAVLIHKGVSPGAALAFLLAGPATNITTFGVLARMHNRRIALMFAAVIAGLAVMLGIGVNLVLGDVGGIDLHERASHDPGWLAISSLGVLALVFVLSVLRQGPRRFIGQVISPHDDGEGDACEDACGDDHGDACGHAHGDGCGDAHGDGCGDAHCH